MSCNCMKFLKLLILRSVMHYRLLGQIILRETCGSWNYFFLKKLKTFKKYNIQDKKKRHLHIIWKLFHTISRNVENNLENSYIIIIIILRQNEGVLGYEEDAETRVPEQIRYREIWYEWEWERGRGRLWEQGVETHSQRERESERRGKGGERIKGRDREWQEESENFSIKVVGEAERESVVRVEKQVVFYFTHIDLKNNHAHSASAMLCSSRPMPDLFVYIIYYHMTYYMLWYDILYAMIWHIICYDMT